MSTTPRAHQVRAFRMAAIMIMILLMVSLFFGGTTALLYFLFSEYTGFRNLWLLGCCAPVAVIVFFMLTAFNLYIRFGRPLESLFNAIDAVGEGDLSVRVPIGNSDLYSDLFKRFNKMLGELERAGQQRRNLTADIAHELRTPLHVIQGNLEGILDGVYLPTAEHLNNTLDETRLLSRLVNDLQTLSLAESGQLPLHLTQFPVADLLNDLATSFAAHATANRVTIKIDLADQTLQMTADYDRLNQVLSNLFANAIRHMSGGGRLTVRAEMVDKSLRHGSGQTIRIVVEDTGSGIAPDDLPFIFDRFWRGDKSRSDRSHSGLGLSIARQLIQSHGGTIEVESEGVAGKGTTFFIELPRQAGG